MHIIVILFILTSLFCPPVFADNRLETLIQDARTYCQNWIKDIIHEAQKCQRSVEKASYCAERDTAMMALAQRIRNGNMERAVVLKAETKVLDTIKEILWQVEHTVKEQFFNYLTSLYSSIKNVTARYNKQLGRYAYIKRSEKIMDKEKMIMYVASSKAGCGCSLFSLALTDCLHQRFSDEKILLVDFDGDVARAYKGEHGVISREIGVSGLVDLAGEIKAYPDAKFAVINSSIAATVEFEKHGYRLNNAIKNKEFGVPAEFLTFWISSPQNDMARHLAKYLEVMTETKLYPVLRQRFPYNEHIFPREMRDALVKLKFPELDGNLLYPLLDGDNVSETIKKMSVAQAGFFRDWSTSIQKELDKIFC